MNGKKEKSVRHLLLRNILRAATRELLGTGDLFPDRSLGTHRYAGSSGYRTVITLLIPPRGVQRLSRVH